ncbi:MAG: helix-turn-helix domain-containing protein [Aquabacterium sp.]|uniref:helix-turn-helix transcriptional regulator n=1 Tax=Aquabacterium sp. TaxID=1872578 RepID=UPI0025C47AAF|nr:LuxR C-terminal-related transcriptional regulator [Aquabacterium sp.]MBI3381174.1 helix-turn-helix domain-containing protein [Aquabacterium sp.]
MKPLLQDSSPVWGSAGGKVAETGDSTSAQTPPLLTTRLHPPRRGRGVLPRPRLEDLSPRLLEQTLTVIKAPPGFGKTTLAAAWVEALTARDVPSAWLTLDDSDDTPSGLLYCMAAALQRAIPALGLDVLALEKAWPFLPADTIATLLANDIHSQPDHLLMVLDDCHRVSEATLDTALHLLLRHAPPQLHLLLISRHDLPATVLQQVRGGLVLAIDAEHLRFMPEETQALLTRAGQTPTATQLASVQEATGGWSTALRAYLLSASNHPRGGLATLPRTLGLLFDDMLMGLDADFRQRLLPLGLLETFNAPMLTHCQGPGADAFIDTLERRQLFLSTHGAEGEWFSLHPLLRDHLTRLLERDDPQQAQDFRIRAADWLAAQGWWSQAISLALAAGDTTQAQSWIRCCAMDLVEQGDFLVLLQWQRRLREHLPSFPAPMRLALAWAAALAMQHDEAQQLLDELPENGDVHVWELRALRAMLLALDDRADEGAALATTCMPHLGNRPWICNVLTNVQRYGLLQAGQWQSLYSLPPLQSQPLSRTRYTFNRLYQHCMEALADVQQAHLAGAAARLEGAFMDLAESGATSPVLRALPAALLARVRLLQGRTSEATALLADSLEFVRTCGFLDSIEAALGSSATLLRQQGNLALARQRVVEIETLAHHRHWPRLLAQALLERSRISLQESKLEEARACGQRLRQLRHERALPPGVDSVAHACVLAELELAAVTGECPTTLLADAETLAAAQGAAHMRLSQMALQIAMVNVHLRLGDTATAEWRLAQWQGAVRQAGASALLESLPSRWREDALAEPVRMDTLHGLTVKERLILQGVARGQSNKEIAKALGVSPETIKTHMKNIFGKLGVSSRTHAAALITQGHGLMLAIEEGTAG